MTQINTKNTIFELKEIFSRLGIPMSITADNGPQFREQNREFLQFCQGYGIKLFHSTPEWPQQNGLVERQNSGILKRLRISQLEGSDWRENLLSYLLMYRSTPHSELGKTPSELLFGRNIRDKIPQIKYPNLAIDFDQLADQDKLRKEKGKIYADQRKRARTSSIEIGDTVLLRASKQNKLSPNFNSEEFTVVDRKGGEIQVKSNISGKLFKRNTSHAVRVPCVPDDVRVENNSEDSEIDSENSGSELDFPGFA